MAKNRAFGNSIIFLQQVFPFGGNVPGFPPPGGAYDNGQIFENFKKFELK